MWRSKAGSLRDSKHPERSPALRSISNNAKERPIVGLGEHIYESTKLAALFDALVDRGCPAGEILRNVNLTVDEVHSPKSRISLADLMTACESELQIPPFAIWIDLIEPTVEEDRKVQEFVGVPVPTKANPDYTEPPEAHYSDVSRTK